MKKSVLLTVVLIASILMVSITGCASTGEAVAAEAPAEDTGNPAEITDTPPGAGAAGGSDDAKINFEEDFGDFTYAAGTALTSVDSKSAISAATDFVYAGSQSMRIDGTLQKDKYSDSIEIGYRIKAAELLGVKNIELIGKTITMWVYVPSEYSNTVVQMVIMDQGYQGVYSPGIEVPAGEWTKVYLKLLSSGSKENEKYPGSRPSLAGYDAEGNKIGQGAYSSEQFNSYTIDTIEIRSLGGEIGDNATVFIDSIDWE